MNLNKLIKQMKQIMTNFMEMIKIVLLCGLQNKKLFHHNNFNIQVHYKIKMDKLFKKFQKKMDYKFLNGGNVINFVGILILNYKMNH